MDRALKRCASLKVVILQLDASEEDGEEAEDELNEDLEIERQNNVC